MCLLTKCPKPRTAVKDIVCYKIVCKSDAWKKLENKNENAPRSYENDAFSFVSEYCHFKYIFGKEYTEEKFETREHFATINIGFHSYNHYHDAKRQLSTRSEEDYYIVKCVIPKGTRYWDGTDYWNTGNIEERCSEKIRIIAWQPAHTRRWSEQLEISNQNEESCA